MPGSNGKPITLHSGSKSIKKDKQVKKKKASWAAFQRAVAAQTQGTGITYEGRWPANVEKRLKQSFSTEQTRQILRHISVQIFYYIRKHLGRTGEQEVQSMLVNDRILVATNDSKSVDALVAKLTDKATTKGEEHGLREILTGKWSSQARQLRGAEKLRAVLAENRAKEVPAAHVLRAIPRKAEDCFEVMDLSRNDFSLVTSLKGQRKIIFVKSELLPHAEQKLALALYTAYKESNDEKRKDVEAHVYGKKRPCFGCYLTLKYLQTHGFPKLVSNQRPGGTWYPPMKELTDHAAHFGCKREAVLEWFLEQIKVPYTAHTTGPDGDTAFDTESDSDID